MANKYLSFHGAVRAARRQLDKYFGESTEKRFEFFIVILPDGKFTPFFWTGSGDMAMQHSINFASTGWYASTGHLAIGMREAMGELLT